MNSLDFEDFAELWREPDPAEQARTEELARKTRRRARWVGLADIALAVVLVGGMVAGTLMRPGPGTAGIAALFIIVTLWLSWKRRQIRQMTLTLNTNDRQSFIDVARKSAISAVRRVTIGMAVLPVFVLLAVLFKLSSRHGGTLAIPPEAYAQWVVSIRGVVVLGGTALILLWQLRVRRRLKQELENLAALERTYGLEAKAEESLGD